MTGSNIPTKLDKKPAVVKNYNAKPEIYRSEYVYKDNRNDRYIKKLIETPESHKECIEWPFSRFSGGYGQARLYGQGMCAHAAVLIVKTNGKPSPHHEAAHECGNRLCVNPNHLSWKTRKENAEDKLRHGTHIKGEQASKSKLTEADVVEIRRQAQAGKPYAVIAREYKMTMQAIRSACIGDSWKHLDNTCKQDRKYKGEYYSKIKLDEIREIIALIEQGLLKATEIAKKYKVSDATISNIKKGKHGVANRVKEQIQREKGKAA